MEKKVPRYITKTYRPTEHEVLTININNSKKIVRVHYMDYNRDEGFDMSTPSNTYVLKSIYETLTRKESRIYVGCNIPLDYVKQIMIDIHNKIVIRG